MNFGIIGFGNIARKFVKSIEYTDEGKIYAIASHSLTSDDEYVKAHPEVKIYQDYDELLQDRELDAVYIALPHKYHKEWILKALDNHIAVLSEKPMVLTVADIEEIKTKVYTEKGYCLEALKTKFNIGLEHLKQDLSLIGKIKQIEANFCFDATAHQTTSYLFNVDQGGALNDVGSYLLGFVLALVDSDIKNVNSQIDIVAGVEWYFKAKINFNNECTAIVEGAIDRNKERLAIIEGEFGKIEIPMFNRIIDYKIIKNDGTVVERNYPIIGDDMIMEIQCFIDDVRAHKTESALHSLEDTKRILELTEIIREAN